MNLFEFNCITEANHLMHIANIQHRLDVCAAHGRQEARAAAREARNHQREECLDIALRVACVIGTIVALAVLSSIVAG